MQVLISGKNINIGQSLQATIEQKAQEISQKYSLAPIDCTVILSKDSNNVRCAINYHLSRNVNVRSTEDSDDAIISVDMAFHSLENRLRRHKKRLVDHHKKHDVNFEKTPARQYVLAAEQDNNSEIEIPENPLIIAEMKTHIPSLSVGEAVMHMDLSDVPAMIFHNNKQEDLINIVYRRPDGNIGWISPNENASAS